MFNRKVALVLYGVGMVGLLVTKASVELVAGFFAIIASSEMMLQQQKKELQNR
ncbi:hypothetical protein [Ectobacillus ponti]|uniref:Uncharacterized protein n=1 Tax=Ectobacillus ponti TaxID=2961894 RepID=A0AA42BP61_9BACI|nr:hypothetical protein [Ectobacillus ponti]MCP8968427.1 hypothetical protein [Ectobacillus ponti]